MITRCNRSLNDKPLRSVGSTFYLVKPWLGNRYFMMRMGIKFNGDEGLGNLLDSDKLRVSIAPLIGWKKNPYTSYAFGFAYSYDFGRAKYISGNFIQPYFQQQVWAGINSASGGETALYHD